MTKTNEQIEKKTLYEKIFYNNKLILVLSFVLAIVLWAVIKINYSENTTRTITHVPVNLDTKLAEENDFQAFGVSDGLFVDVEVYGRAFDINNYSLSRDDITIDAQSGYIDTAGYKTITLNAQVDSSVSVIKITPSTVSVYFDRPRTAQVNVEAKLTNDSDTLVADGFTVGQIAPSVNTANVSGPASVVDNLKKVYFEATVSEDQLPLSETTEVTAQISYAVDKQRDSRFLVCDNVGSDTNPATVTIPVYKVDTVPTSVKFVNQPSYFDEAPPRVRISPAKVEITYTPDEEDYTAFTVGTIDFHDLKTGVNHFTVTADETGAALLSNTAEKTFQVDVDLRGMQSKTIDATGSNVVFLNASNDSRYTVNLEQSGLDNLVLIGTSESLEKIHADALQIEINVSSLNIDSNRWQSAKISNVALMTDGINDCWVYGSYEARVRVSEK